MSGDGRSKTGRSTAAGVVLVLGAFAVVLAGTDSAVFDLERHLVPKALALHLTALALLVLGVPSFREVRWDAPALLLALFVAWSGASTLFAENRWLAFRGWGIGFSSLVLFLAARPVGRARPRGVLAGVLAAAVLGAGLGVAQAYGADWPWLAENRPPGGTFGNRNFLAHLSAIALGPLLVTGVRARGRWVPLVLLELAVLAGAIVLTRSRAAWLGAAASLLVTVLALALLQRRARTEPGPQERSARPWGRLLLAGLFLGTAVSVAVMLPNALRWSSDAPYARTLENLGEYREGSGAGRLVQYRNSLELLSKRPILGVGPGNWFVHYPRVTAPGDPSWSGHLDIPTNPWPSSDWVAMVTERGLPGALLLFLAGTSAVLLALRPRTPATEERARRSGPSPDVAAPVGGGDPGGRDPGDGTGTEDRATRAEEPAARNGGASGTGAAAVGALTAALVTGSFDAVLLLAAPSFFVWTIAGLTLPPGRVRVRTYPSGAGRAAVRGAAVVVVAALLAVEGSSTAALVATRSDDGTAALARAARLAPWEHRLQILLARRGRCENARKASALMPYHDAVRGLARGCGGP